MDSAEPAIAENRHDIVCSNFPGHVRDDFFNGRKVGGGFPIRADFAHQSGRIEAFFRFQQFEPGDLRNDNRIRQAERF